MSSSVLITLLTFSAICSSIIKIYYFRVGKLILTPLKATTICRVNKEIKQVLLYSYTRLAIASPYITSILCVLAIIKGCLIIRKDLSKSSIKVKVAKELFIDRLIEAN